MIAAAHHTAHHAAAPHNQVASVFSGLFGALIVWIIVMTVLWVLAALLRHRA